MSLFKKAGEKFEETKRAFVDGEGPDPDPESAYVCRACEESVGDDYDYCPHCGEDAVDAAE
jgi:rubrerythrin